MSSTFGNKFKIAIFGQSHSAAVGVTIDGIPAGTPIDADKLQKFLDRRAPGRSALTTQRREADIPEFLCGLRDGKSCGAPLTAIIRNTDVRPGDYSDIGDVPRPGHADYTAHIKYGGAEDASGGGHFSGRLTAPLCIAGGIAVQMLEAAGISVAARIVEIGGYKTGSASNGAGAESYEGVSTCGANADKVAAIIENARKDGDSVGGIIECTVKGMPAGIGEPMFDGIENRIAQAVFAIPAVKGIEFGAGFEAARMKGSRNNDAFYMENGSVKIRTNNAGGILGGISSGADIVFRAAFKPTPSIAKAQDSISWSEKTDRTIALKGRHDPCIAVRALPVVEAAAAVALIDYLI